MGLQSQTGLSDFHFHFHHKLSCVRNFEILWTVAQQAPLSLGFSRQKYCSGLSFSSPSEFLDQGLTLHLCVCCIAGGFFST